MPDPTPVTVTIPAKPASQSRTLKFNNLVMWVGGLTAVLPDVIGWCFTMLGDPNVAGAVSNAIPQKSRVAFGVIMAIVAARNRALRYQTTQPIEKGTATSVTPPE